MTTYGVHTGLQRTTTDELFALWDAIERLGFDWISIWDHFYAADLTGSAHCLEAVALHAALACRTSRVRCGSLVYCATYRHPAVLANAIASIDQLSGGRAELGLGAGWHQEESNAYGLPFDRAGVRLDILEESVACVRGLLTQPVTTFEGAHFQLTEARCEPGPVQDRLPIWIGGGGERRTLRIAAQWSDGWNIPFVDPETFKAKRAVLHRHCETIGRDPAEIRCAVNVGLAWREEDFEPQFGAMRMLVRPGVLTGSEEHVRARVGEYVAAGADQVNIAVRAPWDIEGLQRLADALSITARP